MWLVNRTRPLSVANLKIRCSCRDGLPAPPGASKKRTILAVPEESKEKTETERPKYKDKEKDNIPRDRLKHLDLDSLHGSADDRRNVRLFPKQRLKLDSERAIRKRESTSNPKSHVDFTKLSQPTEPLASAVADSDLDDDFPEAYNLLKSMSQKDLPSSELGDHSLESDDGWNMTLVEDQSPSRHLSNQTNMSGLLGSTRKRKRDSSPGPSTDFTCKPSKSVKLTHRVDTAWGLPVDSPIHLACDRAHDPMFLLPSSEQDETNEATFADEELAGDCKLGMHSATEVPAATQLEQDMTGTLALEDEFDELDAFLNSNAVEIV